MVHAETYAPISRCNAHNLIRCVAIDAIDHIATRLGEALH
jgi:hypothetical protein